MPCKRWATSHNPSSAGPRYSKILCTVERISAEVAVHTCVWVRWLLLFLLILRVRATCGTCFHTSVQARPPVCRDLRVRGRSPPGLVPLGWGTPQATGSAGTARATPHTPQFNSQRVTVPHKNRETHCDDDTRMAYANTASQSLVHVDVGPSELRL